MNKNHNDILKLIKDASGQPTSHTYVDSYLGNNNPRYAINAPRLRTIAKDWMRGRKDMSAKELAVLLGSLVKGRSSTEKVMAGVLLDCSQVHQRKFDPSLFEKWLNHLTGWAEVDAVCTGRYCDTEIPANLKQWGPILTRLSKSVNI